jgi:hypothetical protein
MDLVCARDELLGLLDLDREILQESVMIAPCDERARSFPHLQILLVEVGYAAGCVGDQDPVERGFERYAHRGE